MCRQCGQWQNVGFTAGLLSDGVSTPMPMLFIECHDCEVSVPVFSDRTHTKQLLDAFHFSIDRFSRYRLR